LVYNVESNYTPYTDTGAITIYFGSDPKNQQRCTALVVKELNKLKTEPLTERFLAKAKQQMLGQLAISSENKESLALSMGRSILHFNRYDTVEEVALLLEEITAAQLQSIAQEVFADEKLTTFIYKE